MKKVFLFLLLYLASCNEVNDIELITAITDYTKDEFFRHNLTLELIEVTIDSVRTLPIDTIISQALISAKISTWMYSNIEINNDYRVRKLTTLQGKYEHNQTGKNVYTRIKGTQVDSKKTKRNFIAQIDFSLDSYNKIFYGTLWFKNDTLIN